MFTVEEFKKAIFEKKSTLSDLKATRAKELKLIIEQGTKLELLKKDTRKDSQKKADNLSAQLSEDAVKIVDLAAQIAQTEGELNELEHKCYEAEQKEKNKTTKKRRKKSPVKQPVDKLTILFLAANAVQTAPLALDKEMREISDMLRKSDCRDCIECFSRWAVRPLDILQAINELQPEIIHFSGHGTATGELLLEGEGGKPKIVSKEAIIGAITAASEKVRLVFFNACFSQIQAQAIVRQIEAAIGMCIEITDECALIFAAQFYSAIGFGKNLDRAFEQARAAVLLEGLKEENIPVLYVKEGLVAKDIFLVTDHAQSCSTGKRE